MDPGLPIRGEHIWVLFLQNSSRPYPLYPVETMRKIKEKKDLLHFIVQTTLPFRSA